MGGGKAFGITLPVEVIRIFGWRERQRLELVVNERKKSILVRDFRSRRSPVRVGG